MPSRSARFHPPTLLRVTDEPGLYILLLLTSRRMIGRRIGTVLLERARSDCLSRGLTLLRVDCWAGGLQQLVQYYKSAGSQPYWSRSIEMVGRGSSSSSASVDEHAGRHDSGHGAGRDHCCLPPAWRTGDSNT